MINLLLFFSMPTTKKQVNVASTDDTGYTFPPPPYNLDEEKNVDTYQDDKQLRAICSEQEVVPDKAHSIAPQVLPNQDASEEESYDSMLNGQRRVGCISLFWFAVTCDILATIVALLGTMGATLKCRTNCGDLCDMCNEKSRKGLIASLVIFVILSSAIIVFKILSCCQRNKAQANRSNIN